MAECRSCHARIVWVVTEAGKRMPVDAEPVPDGNVEMTGDRVGGSPVVRVLGAPQTVAVTQVRYVSHFATCVQAQSWRR